MKPNFLIPILACLFATISFPAHAAGTTAATCSKVAAAMVEGAKISSSAPVSRTQSSGGEYKWSNSAGYQGVCRFDQLGRVYELSITKFPREVGEEYTLSCKSRKSRYRECALRGAGTARLQRQTSISKCIENQTWGVKEDVLWVNKGCAGSFTIKLFPTWAPYTVRCESFKKKRANCEIEQDAVVRLYRRESNAPCQQGQSWGYSGTNLWVKKNCKAIFEVSPQNSQAPGYDTSRDQAHAQCTEEARKQGFSVQSARISQTGKRYLDVELEIKRDRIEMQLKCRYDVNARTARLYNY